MAYIIRDEMRPTIHHGNGKIYDSKSNFRKATKELGLVEYGNEKPASQKQEFKMEKRLKEELARSFVAGLREV